MVTKQKQDPCSVYTRLYMNQNSPMGKKTKFPFTALRVYNLIHAFLQARY